MSATLALLHILGAAALLVWGLHMVSTGIVRAFGADLRRLLASGLGNRWAAFAAGLAVTAALQSSTATAVMIASFAARGLVEAAPALAIMLGADVGTALVAQVLSLDLSWLSPLLVLGGVVTFVGGRRAQRRNLGRTAIGLGLMLLALHQIALVSAPMRDSATVIEVLGALAGEPLLAVLVAALFAWLAHSSLAAVLLVMSLAALGTMASPLALALVIGANLGGTVAPLTATVEAGPKGRRVPLGNALFKLVGTIAVLPLLDPIAAGLAALDMAPAREVVNFHVAFNLALAAAFIFFTAPTARLCRLVVRDRAQQDDPGRPRYLDPSALETPAIALATAARETLRMADIVETMLRDTLKVFATDDRDLAIQVSARDDVVDALHEAIKLYLTRVSRQALDEEESRRCMEILAFTTNLEHIGDIVDKNLIDLAQKKIRNRMRFSDEGWDEIRALYGRLLDNLKLAGAVFVSDDVRSARRLLEEKVHFRDQERTATDSHLERLRQGRSESIETSAVHLDVLRDLKRVNSHLTSVAYPILDAAGELQASRLRADGG